MSADGLLGDVLRRLSSLDCIRPNSIPGVSLCVSRMAAFVSRRLTSAGHCPSSGVLAGAVVGGCAGGGLLPPPIGGGCSERRLLLLIFVCCFGGVLSVGSVRAILTPLARGCFPSKDSFRLTSVCGRIYGVRGRRLSSVGRGMATACRGSTRAFARLTSNRSGRVLRRFTFVYDLDFSMCVGGVVVRQVVSSLSSGSSGGRRGGGKGWAFLFGAECDLQGALSKSSTDYVF